jgi:hypothetical protein
VDWRGYYVLFVGLFGIGIALWHATRKSKVIGGVNPTYNPPPPPPPTPERQARDGESEERRLQERFLALHTKLTEVGALRACARCTGNDLLLEDGYLSPLHHSNHQRITVRGISIIPCAGVICKRCGHVSMHAIDILGLLPEYTRDTAQE